MRPRLQLDRSKIASPLVQALGTLAVIGQLVACAPPTPSQKASEAARELNWAARWGKMEEAVQRASADHRATFRKNRAAWHDDVTIVDTELASLDMKDATHATVQVDVSWNFVDDPTLRVTRLSQEWSDAEGKWVMLSEECVSGDTGLFGEEVKRLDQPKDKHFPSRTIHSSAY
jgi:hypothetical protein